MLQKRPLTSIPYTGPSYERVLELRKQFVTPSAVPFYRKPLLIHRGEMQFLYDHKGVKYLDLFAGIVTVSVGHCHP
jgi:alanine-glyoxylate transaminase/(R)-3-amino-2-methylpropionate-pyruvate transaminase